MPQTTKCFFFAVYSTYLFMAISFFSFGKSISQINTTKKSDSFIALLPQTETLNTTTLASSKKYPNSGEIAENSSKKNNDTIIVRTIKSANAPIITEGKEGKAGFKNFLLIVMLYTIGIFVFIYIMRRLIKNNNTNFIQKGNRIYALVSSVIVAIIVIRFLYEKPTSFGDFSLDFRGGIDEPTMILIGVLIPILVLWYHDRPIKDLFDWILGNSPSLENLEKQTNELLEDLDHEAIWENRDYDKADKKARSNRPNNDYETTIRRITSRASDLQELLLIIGDEIESLLKQYIKVHEKSKNTVYFIDIKKIANDTDDRNIIDYRLKSIIIGFFEIRDKVSSPSSIKRLIEVGKRILKILINNFYGFLGKTESQERNIKNINVKINHNDKSKGNGKNGEYEIVADITRVDNNDRHVPLEYLDASNVSIVENGRTIRPQKVSYLGNKQSKFNILFLIDDSTSMEDGNKDFNKVKDQLIKLIEILKRHTNFDTSIGITTLTNPKKSAANFPLDKWYNLNTDYDEIMEKINAIKLQDETSGFGTPLFHSINECYKEIEEQIQNTSAETNLVVVLSDGEDTNHDTKQENIEKLNASIPKLNCQLKFIGYEWTPTSEIIDIVKRSGAGGKGLGYFCNIKDEELEQVFNDILQSVLKRYRISWRTYFPNGKGVTRTIRVNYKGKKSEDVPLDL
jgi:hypothetical protein